MNCGDRWRKRADEITDRAKRYRATSPECAPAGQPVCAYCGTKRNVGVHHRDGDESNTARGNLRWACKSCNGRIAAEMKRKGRGVRTAQYNPGAVSAEQWALAVLSMKGESDAIPVDAAREIIRETPAKRRSQFAREIVRHKGMSRKSSSELVSMLTRRNGTDIEKGDKVLYRDFPLGPQHEGLVVGRDKDAGPGWLIVRDYGRGVTRSHQEHKLEKVDRRRRSNPEDQAAALSEAFHGVPPETEIDFDEILHEHSKFAGLGEMEEIILTDGTKLDFDGVTVLASNEAGSQLFLVGGDQAVSKRAFPEIDWTKESVVLGKVKALVYVTAKEHLDARDRQKGPYKHKLGEESGDLPYLVYDVRNKLLSFSGGSYYIKRDMDGGRHSAGLRD